MGNPPLQKGNKVYTLKPQFITDLQNYFRKIKLSQYKKKKVNESKTPHQRFYHMKFKINVVDDFNPQGSETVYEMVVPARAAFFAKTFLERSIKEKITVDVVEWDEMSDEEHQHYKESKEEFINPKVCPHENLHRIGKTSERRYHCMDCSEEIIIPKG